jgi:CobQ-like glutamine amidotransferase family enzyme
MPDAQFVFTSLLDEPYFAQKRPDMILIGYMTENTQRRVIEKLMPLKDRLNSLIDDGVVILATGNAGEIFCKHISYVTEKLEADGLGIFDLTVKTDLFKRYNGMVLGQLENMKIVGFRSQFSFVYGDNSNCYFLKCLRGIGINPDSKLEGMRKNNLICTHLLGPILPLNPLFCEYLLQLCGCDAKAAYKETAMDAYNQRLEEFSDSNVQFESTH